MWENINCGDFINCGRLSSLLWVVLNAISFKQNPKEQQFFLVGPSLILLTWLLLAMIDTQNNSIQSWNFGNKDSILANQRSIQTNIELKKMGSFNSEDNSVSQVIIDTGWIRIVPKKHILKAFLSWKRNCVLLLMEDDYLTVHRQTPMSIHILKTYDIVC